MAHNLFIENGKAHMMYAGQPPWHGLGTQLAEPATSAEAIKAAGLDWKVRKVPLFAIEGTGVVPVSQYFGIAPEDRWGKPDCPIFGIVGKDYHPLQNSEAFEFFDSIVGQKVAMYHTAGALGKGEHVWILAKLSGMMEVTPSDVMEKYVLLSTGHDGRTCVKVILTPVRVVCQNTLSLALKSGDEIARAYHTPSIDRQLDSARKEVQALMKGFDAMQKAFQSMAKYTMTESKVNEYVNRVFPLPKDLTDRKAPEWILEDRANCVHLFHSGIGNDLPGVKETLWAAYNGVTEYVDHWRDRGDREHMYAVCFGRGFQIKSQAYKEALTMVGPVSAN
jgi:phage/plasmid-like protein (TIGR03299 family)